MQGVITQKEEWLYPDSELGRLPHSIDIHTASNGKRAIQLLLSVDCETARITFENNENIDIEVYQMIDVPVEYNCADTTAQNGNFVIMDATLPKPEYCTRKAPFRVYDCLKPVNDLLEVKSQRMAAYICFSPKPITKPGVNIIRVKVSAGAEIYELDVCLHVHNVSIPDETLKITNWFFLENMADDYGFKFMSPEFKEMVRKYARVMRRTRQTHFFLQIIPEKCIKSRNPLELDFSYIKDVAEIFFDEGLTTLELGSFATRSGSLFDVELKCLLDDSIPINSDEGYFLTTKLVRALADFLRVNKWEDKVVLHILDEPDVHVENEEALEKRKQQYFCLTNIVRKHISGVKTIEAVKTAKFKSGIDIWTPLTIHYEEDKEQYDRLIEAGDEVWTYVCCVPGGHYLNRFLDMELIRSRLIFWGCSKYNLSGYLHWGFNYYPKDFNPFEMSCCTNETGLGTSFPAGDSHITYPGDDGPWFSIRLEAQRRGIEDFELLKILKEKDKSKYFELMDKTFTSNVKYNKNVDDFEKVYAGLLEHLEN